MIEYQLIEALSVVKQTQWFKVKADVAFVQR